MKYIYICEECGKFELDQRITEDVIKECPYCSGKVERVITGGAGVIYRVPGFYNTDH